MEKTLTFKNKDYFAATVSRLVDTRLSFAVLKTSDGLSQIKTYCEEGAKLLKAAEGLMEDFGNPKGEFHFMEEVL